MTDPSSGGSLLWPSPLTMVEKIFLGVVLRITLRAFRLGGVRCRRSNWFQTVGRAEREVSGGVTRGGGRAFV